MITTKTARSSISYLGVQTLMDLTLYSHEMRCQRTINLSCNLSASDTSDLQRLSLQSFPRGPNSDRSMSKTAGQGTEYSPWRGSTHAVEPPSSLMHL